MSTTLRRRLDWGGAERGDAYATAIDLAPSARGALGVDVDHGECALVVEDGEVTATLLPGHHQLLVLDADEDPGDLGPTQRADRLGIEREDLDGIQARLRWVRSGATLCFVAAGDLGLHDLASAPTQTVERADGRRLSVGVRGVYRPRIDDPARFYASFLRGSETLSQSDFSHILRALVSGTVARSVGEEWDGSGGGEFGWGERARGPIRSGLRQLGLELDEFELTRVEIEELNERAPAEASLATPVARG